MTVVTFPKIKGRARYGDGTIVEQPDGRFRVQVSAGVVGAALRVWLAGDALRGRGSLSALVRRGGFLAFQVSEGSGHHRCPLVPVAWPLGQ